LSGTGPGAEHADSCGQEGSFESSLAELEGVVRELEEGQLGLTEALACYEQGIGRLKHCYALLQAAERRVEVLTGLLDDGTPLTQPLPESSESLTESTGRRRNTGRPRRTGRTAAERTVGPDGDVDEDGDSL
jgi:exodeoxyribonuclease VII small subunit